MTPKGALTLWVGVAVACSCSWSPGDGGDKGVEAPVIAADVEADGRNVVVVVGGDPCSTVERTDVDEGPTEVVVAVYLAGPDDDEPGCAGMTGTEYQVPITLDDPLGDRVIRARGGGTVVVRKK